eukprot:GHVS01058662.1.p1 GENE.GHVS01058662.1~~GHVS01058662.1.p1  ORF type:complete len:746 (+),score=128.86 GHVS01058662.1:118-2238(+)
MAAVGGEVPYFQQQRLSPAAPAQPIYQQSPAAGDARLSQPPPPPPEFVQDGLESHMVATEAFYLKYYCDAVMRAGASIEVATSQAKEAIAKLHELGYFNSLREVYLKRAQQQQPAYNAQLVQAQQQQLLVQQAQQEAHQQLQRLRQPMHALTPPTTAGLVVNGSSFAAMNQQQRLQQQNLFQFKLNPPMQQQGAAATTRTRRNRFDVRDVFSSDMSHGSPSSEGNKQETAGIVSPPLITGNAEVPKPSTPKPRSPRPPDGSGDSSSRSRSPSVRKVRRYRRRDSSSEEEIEVGGYDEGGGKGASKQQGGGDRYGGGGWPHEMNDESQHDFIPLFHPKKRGGKLKARGRGRAGGLSARAAKRLLHQEQSAAVVTRISFEERGKRMQRMERFTSGGEMNVGGETGGGGDYVICREVTSTAQFTVSQTVLTWQQKLELAKSTAKLVGLSSALEKPFLRLCGPPDPNTVRPEHVLRESFKLVMNKWNTEKNWRYCEEQFRSIRQDLTVQGVKNEFALEVYESNARIALQNSDMGQFNQCQAQLPELYRILNKGLQGSHRAEFTCYRLLYLALQNMRLDLLRIVGELNPEEKNDPSIRYAMKIRVSLAEGNYNRFFRLYKEAPFCAQHLLNMFCGRLRVLSLLTMSLAFKKLPLIAVRDELKFSSSQECIDFLNSEKCVWLEPSKYIDGKSSYPLFAASPLLRSRKVKALG